MGKSLTFLFCLRFDELHLYFLYFRCCCSNSLTHMHPALAIVLPALHQAVQPATPLRSWILLRNRKVASCIAGQPASELMQLLVCLRSRQTTCALHVARHFRSQES